MVFGVNDIATFESLTKEDIEEIKKKLGDLTKNNLTIEESVY